MWARRAVLGLALLLGACGGDDAAVSEDAAADAVSDVVVIDIPADGHVPADVPTDVPADVGADVPPDIGPMNACLPLGDGPGYRIASRAALRWKRSAVMEADLQTALGLEGAAVCGEIGLDGNCFDRVHLVALGGNDPIELTMYTPIPEPNAFTPLAVDRVVSAACGRRADLDWQAQTNGEPAQVFDKLDLTAATIDPETAGLGEQVDVLYRRLLARDPSVAERDIVRDMAAELDGEALSPREFAKLACVAIATTTEFIFQ